ncbi:MAG: guanylate kinase [Firmicutes bacterium HGW-Firmicutes-14]|jgi:guanylate kinase|nr:MAG: guanylate kinase [Firmicutes bacterium HGW-Firmicutes-14]
MTAPGLLIVISGPSGTGKGTICQSLLKRRPDIFLSVSATTRSPRAGEIDGVHYHFRDRETFEEMIARDEFFEWAQVYDNYYGTPKGPVNTALAEGKDVLLEIDVQGALKIKKKAPDGIYIFVVPPSLDALRARITGRGTDSVEVINKRMNKAMEELAYLHEYDYIVINDILEEAVHRAESIIMAEQSRTGRFRIINDGRSDRPLVAAR